uniref:Uncharacterized protein n=1 Tax=Triticum urartu TaxID=4572 RepID=A0A8R7R667_TRIUA
QSKTTFPFPCPCPPHAALPSPPHRRRPAPSPPPEPTGARLEEEQIFVRPLPDLYRLPRLLPLSVRKPPSFGTAFRDEEPNRIQSNPGGSLSSRPSALTSRPQC